MDGKIITIAQQKGGAGKTMLAAHLAVCLAMARGKTVAVLDVDPQGSLGEWFERREAILGEEATGLTFATSSGWGSRREAGALARDHDYVLVDTPPHAESEIKQAIRPAALALVPIQPAHMDLWATQPTLEMAQQAEIPAVLVLNRVPSRARLTAEVVDALGGLSAKVARSRIGNRVLFAESMGRGLTATEMRPKTVASEEIKALAREVARLAAG